MFRFILILKFFEKHSFTGVIIDGWNNFLFAFFIFRFTSVESTHWNKNMRERFCLVFRISSFYNLSKGAIERWSISLIKMCKREKKAGISKFIVSTLWYTKWKCLYVHCSHCGYQLTEIITKFIRKCKEGVKYTTHLIEYLYDRDGVCSN